MKILPMILLLCFSVNAMASAIVTRDDQKGILTVESTLVFSGPEATQEMAIRIVHEITKMWNEPKARVYVRGIPYRVQFLIGFQLNVGPKKIFDNSCRTNFIKIAHLPANPDPKKVEDVSSFQTGLHIGHFYVENDLGNSTTAAHEFGHALGLRHSMSGKIGIIDGKRYYLHDDFTDVPVPGIMFPRGVKVRAEFQYDPKAAPGTPGGYLNPYTRKVLEQDVQSINWNRVLFNKKNQGCIGDGFAS